jgi:predicted nuclease of predicted toxin-antitoxin system
VSARHPSQLRVLLDEHYPPKLAQLLEEAGVDAVALLGGRPTLIGTPDAAVLRAARQERRVVVTEDVTTFPAAIIQVPDHLGVIYCRSQVFRRTPNGLGEIARALAALAANPPTGLGTEPLIWWLSPAA